jgi:hypothetical protein
MPLPFIFNAPTDGASLRRFFFMHASDHTEIQQATLKQKGVNIFARVLDPVDTNDDAFSAWVELHQQAHNDANAALKLNGQDLTDIELKDPDKLREWIWENAEEHQALRQTLGI